MKFSFLMLVMLVASMTPAFITPALAQDPDLKIPISVLSRDTTNYGKLLATRLQQAVSRTGMSEYDSYNFVLFPRINVISRDLTSGAPTLHVVDLELTLSVANGYNNKSIIFSTQTFPLKGIGPSEERAMIDAIRKLSADKPELQKFINDSRFTILKYFGSNCKSIINDAELMAKSASLAVANGMSKDKSITAETQFSQAINLLYNIRSANQTCYEESLGRINKILDQYDDFSCRLYVGLAKNYWAAREVDMTIAYLNKIPPSNKCKTDVDALLLQMNAYQKTQSDQALQQQIQMLRERERASKDILDVVIAGQKRETQTMREARRETVINVLAPPAPQGNK